MQGGDRLLKQNRASTAGVPFFDTNKTTTSTAGCTKAPHHILKATLALQSGRMLTGVSQVLAIISTGSHTRKGYVLTINKN